MVVFRGNKCVSWSWFGGIIEFFFNSEVVDGYIGSLFIGFVKY